MLTLLRNLVPSCAKSSVQAWSASFSSVLRMIPASFSFLSIMSDCRRCGGTFDSALMPASKASSLSSMLSTRQSTASCRMFEETIAHGVSVG